MEALFLVGLDLGRLGGAVEWHSARPLRAPPEFFSCCLSIISIFFSVSLVGGRLKKLSRLFFFLSFPLPSKPPQKNKHHIINLPPLFFPLSVFNAFLIDLFRSYFLWSFLLKFCVHFEEDLPVRYVPKKHELDLPVQKDPTILILFSLR